MKGIVMPEQELEGPKEAPHDDAILVIIICILFGIIVLPFFL